MLRLISMITTKDNCISIWQEVGQADFEVLNKDIHTDVCVIGAGIAGLSTAYTLAQKGMSVVVIDDGEIGGRQTLRSTAHLTNAYDDRYFKIENLHGASVSRLVAESHTAAINKIKQIASDEMIDCNLATLDGYLILDSKQSEPYLHKELKAAARAGVPGVDMLPQFPYSDFDLGPCLNFPYQAQIHPSKYMLGLAQALLKKNAKLFHQTRAVGIVSNRHSYVLTSEKKKIFANYIVVATNTPFNTALQVHLKQAAYRTYVITCSIPQGSFPSILLWDTGHPYHYVRKYEADDGDYLIIGGEDHRTGQGHHHEDQAYIRLEEWARERFPFITNITHRWSGQIIEPVDGLGYIGALGPDQRNVFVVSGDSGNGMTHGAIAGMLIPDLILGNKNEWASVYDPHRISVKATPSFLKENINTAFQYKDWITPGESYAADSIEAGTGSVVRNGLIKIAAFRDDNGVLHQKSAVCTHLGGIVHWNDAEKTWDCPCHGSRFSALGEVINGPATHDLKDVGVKVELIGEPVLEKPRKRITPMDLGLEGGLHMKPPKV